MNGWKTVAAGIAAAALGTAVARADDSRCREFAVGARAAGMGGAAIATAADVDSVYYNPAGLAGSQADSLSLSASLYGFDRWKLKNGFGAGDDADGTSFVTVPSALGGVKRFNDEWTGGFGVFTPKMERRRILDASKGREQFHNYTMSDQTIWAGPALAWGKKDGKWRIGGAVLGVYRELSLSIQEQGKGEGAVFGACDLNALGVMALLGVQGDLGNGWSVGLTAQSPNFAVTGSGKYSVNYMVDLDSTTLGGGTYSENVDADNQTPAQLGIGLAKKAGPWTFAADATWRPSTHYDLMQWKFDGREADVEVHLKSVVDASVGAEYLLAEKYPLRAGFFTAFSGARRDEAEGTGSEIAASDVDMYGVTCSVGRQTGPMTVDVGLQYMWGRGKELGYTDGEGRMGWMPCRRDVVLCSISTTYLF